MNGGHEVPISKVISRYFKSLEQVKQAITFVDRSYIYDNSIEDHQPQLLFRTVDGTLAKQYIVEIPEWAQILI
jgi:predicted ABC-type ATPase